ncbi:MAG: carbonic anhydrase [Bacteroidales bacterium]|nr:carbonic anhydrase [Bacteroidales bacterium]
MDYKEIFENNRIWAENRKATNPEFFEHLAEGQNPDYLIISCSDSRVTPESICGAEPGDFLVHRNVANLVNSTDQNLLSVIAFALSVLEVKHIVVCGHTNCGGVIASLSNNSNDVLKPWLNLIRQIEKENLDELDAIHDQDSRCQRLTELNTIQQCRNLTEMDIIKKSINALSRLQIHGWMYDLGTGQLRDLNFENTHDL